MARRCYDEMQMSATIARVHSDACRDPVEDIRNDAFDEYQRVKKHKQNELNTRRLNEQPLSAKNGKAVLTKQQKKKDDNHASAVASRSKQEFLLKKFEEVLLKKIADTKLLSMGYTDSQQKIIALNKIIQDRDNTIRCLNEELSMYRATHTHTHTAQSPRMFKAEDRPAHRQAPPYANGNGNGNTNSSNNNQHNANIANIGQHGSHGTHGHQHATHAVDLAATMDEIISTEVTPFDVTAHKLANTNPHVLVSISQWAGRTPEEFGMSYNLNPAA